MGLWKFFNSALGIALISAITATLLTQWFVGRQTDSEDMASRRAELSRDIVELELRMARLRVIEAQGAVAPTFSAAAISRDGERAKAIIAGDSRTVTSDPSFRDIHLVTLLGRAETAAGVDLSDKDFMLDFTDRDDDSAVALTPYVLCRTNQLVFYLKKHFQSQDFPLAASDRKRRRRDSSVYRLINASTLCPKPH